MIHLLAVIIMSVVIFILVAVAFYWMGFDSGRTAAKEEYLTCRKKFKDPFADVINKRFSKKRKKRHAR